MSAFSPVAEATGFTAIPLQGIQGLTIYLAVCDRIVYYFFNPA